MAQFKKTVDCDNSILDRLPVFVPTNSASGVDRYGFSTVLATRCGRRIVPRSFASWMDGWNWVEDPTAECLHCSNLPRDMTVIVGNRAEQFALESVGFKDVRIGGLPFAYIQRQHAFRHTDALLSFPAHILAPERSETVQFAYLDYLETLKRDFDSVYVSIFYLDLGGPLHKAAEARGLRVIPGAHPYDANSLLRTRSMLDSFMHVTSNAIGSHVVYALFSGCKFSFCGPIHDYDETVYLWENPHERTSDFIKNIRRESYLREKFGRFFVDHPRMGLQDTSFAADAIGERFVMTPHQIEDALGWGVLGQVKGYLSGARRRLSRLITTSHQRE